MANWREKLKSQLEVAESPEWNSVAREFSRRKKATVSIHCEDIESSLRNFYEVPFGKAEPTVEICADGFRVYFDRTRMKDIAPVLYATYLDGEKKQLRLWFEQRDPDLAKNFLAIIFGANLCFALVVGFSSGSFSAALGLVAFILPMQIVLTYFNMSLPAQQSDIVSLLDHFCKCANIELHDVHFETQLLS